MSNVAHMMAGLNISRSCCAKLPLNFVSRPVTVPRIVLAESDNTASKFFRGRNLFLNNAFMKKRLSLVQEYSKCSTSTLFVTSQ